MEMDFLRRSSRCSRLEKNRNNVIREKYIKNSVLGYIRYKQLNWYSHVQKCVGRKGPSENFGMVPTWKVKKGKTSKFVDAGGCNRNVCVCV